MALKFDANVCADDIAALASPDALAAFFQAKLGYDTGGRRTVPFEATGLPASLAGDVRHVEVLAEYGDDYFGVLLVQLRSVTAKARADLARAYRRSAIDYLFILTSDFDALEFMLLEKTPLESAGPGPEQGPRVQPRSFVVPRRYPQDVLRIVGRLSFTATDADGRDNAMKQFVKLQRVFDAAHYSGRHFRNQALFADHYLATRVKEGRAWKLDPAAAFDAVRELMQGARDRFGGKGEQSVRDGLYAPLWKVLGFAADVVKKSDDPAPEPDYRLKAADGSPRTVALVYAWERWLDGPDGSDPDTPGENPGAAVVSLLERGDAEWVIVTNGKYWRLYSRQAHSRSTNFYEVDLEDVLVQSGQTDPHEGFQYWWLFFREAAFAPAAPPDAPAPAAAPGQPAACWLDAVAAGSREYAREVEEELRPQVFHRVVPLLAAGFLEDRRGRLRLRKAPTQEELEQVREATLTLLYRILFLLYAESRDLLPVRESAYYEESLKKLKEEIAAEAGVAESGADEALAKAFAKPGKSGPLYDRLKALFAIMAGVDAKENARVNVPNYNGGLFRTAARAGGAAVAGAAPAADRPDDREAAVAAFLDERRVPDVYLAQAIDRLARLPDPRQGFHLVFVDYKSLGVRQLGSIYEGLLEYRLKLAEEDLPPAGGKAGKGRGGKGKAASLTAGRAAKASAGPGVKKGEPYLANDKAERKATGSYYTPDNIVVYIVANTVGPVLRRKLDALRPLFAAAQKTYQRFHRSATEDPRVMLGWRPHGLAPGSSEPAAAPQPRLPRPRTEEERRLFALDKTYEEHRDLVEKLFDLKVLDPSMGSGHFLVEAVDFITDELLHFLNDYPDNPVMAALARTRASILDSLADQGIQTDEAMRRQLTDVHLLKRHVLKRCIYGVDLNPLATELAKVSLWLDAFTLGAPLSFLDHHLHTGDSLIGASVPEFLKATEGQLFSLDYEPMKRAIRNALFIAALSDATAAEAHESSERYSTVRRELSGYKVVLDLLVADCFGHKTARDVVISSIGKTDLSDRARFFASQPPKVKAMVEAVEELARQRRFFHWDLSFLEVFFRFRSTSQQDIEPKPVGEAGFDAIVGNPPFVRQEALKQNKAYFRTAFAGTFDAANDLYVFFMHRELDMLRAGGLMGMIVANKWLRAGYGEKLRLFLRRSAVPQSIIDFGHAPIFPEADTFPCIPILGRRAERLPDQHEPSPDEVVTVCSFPREEYEPDVRLASAVLRRRKSLPVRLLRPAGWSLEDPAVQVLMDKIRGRGETLAEQVGSPPLRGLLTGFNDAFYIDQQGRDRLVASDPKSARIIRPLIRGRDIDRWAPQTGATFMITIPSSANAKWPWSGMSPDAALKSFRRAFPAVAAHLEAYEVKLVARQDQGHYWWELRSCDYMSVFDKPHIAYQVILYHSFFCSVDGGAVHNDKAYMLPTDDLALLGVLSSPLMWWFLTRTLPHMKDEALSPAGFIMENLRVTTGDLRQADQLREAVRPLLECADRLHQWQGESVEQACELIGASERDARIVNWVPLGAGTFVSRMKQLAPSRRIPAALEEKLRAFHQRSRGKYLDLLRDQLEHETRVAALVEDAFGLTEDDRALLRETRPVRDPLDVLRGKLAGESAEEVTADGD